MMLDLLKAELSAAGITCDIIDLGDQEWLTDTDGKATVCESGGRFQVHLLGQDLGVFGLYPSVVLLREMLSK